MLTQVGKRKINMYMIAIELQLRNRKLQFENYEPSHSWKIAKLTPKKLGPSSVAVTINCSKPISFLEQSIVIVFVTVCGIYRQKLFDKHQSMRNIDTWNRTDFKFHESFSTEPFTPNVLSMQGKDSGWMFRVSPAYNRISIIEWQHYFFRDELFCNSNHIDRLGKFVGQIVKLAIIFLLLERFSASAIVKRLLGKIDISLANKTKNYNSLKEEYEPKDTMFQYGEFLFSRNPLCINLSGRILWCKQSKASLESQNRPQHVMVTQNCIRLFNASDVRLWSHKTQTSLQ